MKVYMYFLRVDRHDRPDFEFLREYSYCLKNNYSGGIPVNRDNPDEYRILYAFTKDKSLAKLFENDRDMNIFCKVTVDMGKVNYKNFVETASPLQMHIRDLYDGERDIHNDLLMYPTVLTDFEWTHVADGLMLSGSFMPDQLLPSIDTANFLPTSKIFTDEIQDILHDFGFEIIMELVNPGGADNGEIDFFDEQFKLLWNRFTYCRNPKTLSIFIKLFGLTLKGGDE